MSTSSNSDHKSEEASDPQYTKGELKDEYEVDLESHEHPQDRSLFRKWLIVAVISIGSLCVTAASSAPSFTEKAIVKEFHVTEELSILPLTLYAIGLGIGPLLTGPLSEVYGRNLVYRTSYALITALTFGCAFAPNIACLLVFRFLTGLCGATFLSVSGGSVSDLFEDSQVGIPMGVFVLSPFVGPLVGPIYSGFVNQYASWRWTYYTLIIWSFVETVALFVLVPETYVPVLRKWKAEGLRKSTGNSNYWAPLERRTETMTQAVIVSCYRPFQLLANERMALLLNLWAALIFGILYLTFQAYPVIFGKNHHWLNYGHIGLAFIGAVVGEVLGVCLQPLFQRFLMKEARKAGGLLPPPEARLLAAEVGAICIPISLYWMAFTSYPDVHWIAPIIASIFFGLGIYLVFSSVLTYLIVAYRPIAASAMSSDTAMISTFAAAFPLFAGQMYARLGTDGATALLAGLTTLAAPLPFIFRRIGARLRAKSRWAAQDA